MAIGDKDVMKFIISARDNTRGAFTKVGAQIRKVKGDTKGLNKGLGVFRSTLGSLPGPAGRLVGALGPLGIAGAAIAATAAIGLFAASAVKSFSEFEDSMANVRKTTGMTKEETTALGGSIDSMALRLPVAHGELAKIAAIAGQLGIQGKTSILGFTEDIAKMATAFDMAPEAAATAMAKMANIYDIPIENISALGSAINVLGNTTAAQESSIMDFAMSLGASAKQLGFCETEAIAMGATLISMGMDASASGTRLNAAFTQMAKNTDMVSKFLGKTETDFRAAFGEDPMGMITEISAKLALIQDPLERNAAAAEMFGLVGAKSINALGGDLDGLQTNLANAASGLAENTSLTEEFAAKTDTLKAKFALVGNAAESLKINIGQALAPIAGILAEGVSKGISGISKAFDAMQKVAGPVLDLVFLRFHVLKAFLEGLFTPIIGALAPLSSLFEGTGTAVSKLNIVLEVMKDVFTIITGIARKLGTILGTLLANAITPLVAKIKEGIATLTEFYDKLGPVKGLIEGIKDKVSAGATAIGEWADSFEETVPPVEELTDAITELGEEAEKVGPVLTESIKTLESSLTEASGNYKTAIGDISQEIDTLKDAWNLASDDQKAAIEKQIDALEDIKSELEDGEEAQKAYFDNIIEGTEEAAEAQKEFKVTIGDTTITFKDMAAEVIKNADAYADLQKNAEALLDLDWSVFTKLEADLPNIDAGIKSMSDAFSGLKDVLEDNITELENVKESVMAIGEIAAPFIEEGFIESISAISSFSGALSDAGGAINTFTNLQDVSTEGAKEFSSRIHNMVSALEILEDQMEDLVSSFEAIGDLSTSIAKNFLGGTEYIEETGKAAEYLAEQFKNIKEKGSSWDIDPWGITTHGQLGRLLRYMGATNEQAQELIKSLGPELQSEMVKLAKESNTASEFINKLNNSSLMLNVSVDIATTKLKEQTGQLKKITDALAPYLNFMRTLSELSALSTLSVEELNNGFTAIEKTLTNLSVALTDFDLKSVMESSFNAIKNFTDSWEEATSEMGNSFETFENILNIISRISSNIIALSKTFETLKETTIISARDMNKAMQNIDVFINRFTKALSLNLDSLVDSLVDLDIEWSRHAKEMENVMPSYKHASSSIGTLLSPLASLSSALKELSEMGAIAATTFDTGFTALITSIGNFAISLRKNVDPLIGSLRTLRTVWVENEVVLVPLMRDLIIIAKSFTSVAVNVNNMVIAFDTLSKNSGSLEKGFKTLIKFIKNVVEETKKFYTPESARAIKQYIIDIANVIGAFKILGEKLENATSDIEKEVTTTVNNIARSILSLKSLIPSMFVYGAGMMFSFISGINAWIPVLRAQLISIANMIKSYLGVSSPTELGALKDVEKWPKNLVKSFASGIRNEMSTLNNSFSGMTLAAPGGCGSGKVTHVTFHVTQNIKDKATADYSTRELERMINRHEIL